MKHKLLYSFAFFFLLFQSGCGYLVSGTWEDDPKNWQRAFHTQKPDNVVVLHSKYYRSPHFTYEFQYFFEIEQNDLLEEQLFTQNELVKIEDEEHAKEEATSGVLVNAPEWFVPKKLRQYDMWRFKDEPQRNFRVFIDRQTGNLFLTDYLF